MDTPEKSLVQVGAAPSAAVAGLVAASIAPNTKRSYEAALKRLDAALEGQDLTDASLSIYIASLHAAGLSPAVASMAVASVKFRCRLQGRVSGHSLRVGGAQSLAAGGASIVEMQTAGRWQSPTMPGHYARGQLAARGAVARVRYGRG